MNGHTPISNNDDIIDSRDVIARIDWLDDDEESYKDAIEDARTPAELADAESEYKDWLESDEHEELQALREFAEEAEGYCPDWPHGATLIHEDYFETYAQELAEDIGATSREQSWPHTCIDWEQAARDLAMDYTCVDFDGVTYYVR